MPTTYPNHGRRRRPRMTTFQQLTGHDIISIERQSSLVYTVTPTSFFSIWVSVGDHPTQYTRIFDTTILLWPLRICEAGAVWSHANSVAFAFILFQKIIRLMGAISSTTSFAIMAGALLVISRNSCQFSS